MSRTTRKARQNWCAKHNNRHEFNGNWNQWLNHWRQRDDDPYHCGDCRKAEKKFVRKPDGLTHSHYSEGMRVEKRNERRSRRHNEKQLLEQFGDEPQNSVDRQWLD